MHLLHKKPKLLATLLVKNEEDILEHTIKHHISLGIEAFIITDNNSTDKTKEIAHSFKEVFKVFDEPDETHHQEKHVTKMAHYACKFKPEWIVHLDADEFWNGFEYLDEIKQNGVASTIAYIHPPIKSDPKFDPIAQRFFLDMKEIQSVMEETKILHRPSEKISIHHGNHWMDNIEGEILRTEKIYRHHYPLRNYKQLVSKAIKGHEAMISRNAYCGRWGNWYDLYKNNKLEKKFEIIVENWKKMTQEGINKETIAEMVSFYAGSDEGLERILDALEKITPEIKEWTPLKAQ